MKKLIFIIMMLALMVSSNLVLGQTAVHNSWPMPISCANDPLHPIAGKPYTYNVDVTPTGGDFQWWATKDYNFIVDGANNIGTALTVAPGELIATSANYGTTDVYDTVSITWSSEILANTDTLTNPTFVAVQYDAPASGCANNLKVYSIMPVTAFTVDILNLDALGDTLAYGLPLDTCTSDIDSAIFILATRSIKYNFGDNQLLFEVVLANFTDSAYVSFDIAGLAPPPYDQTVDLAWGYTIVTAGANTLGTGLMQCPSMNFHRRSYRNSRLRWILYIEMLHKNITVKFFRANL